MQLPLTFKNNTTPNKKQRGDFLIESLIGVLLIGIVGAGITQTAGHIAQGQAKLEDQNFALSQLKSLVISGNPAQVCQNNLKISTYSTTISLSSDKACQTTSKFKTIPVTIDGVTVTPPNPVVVSASLPNASVGDTSPALEVRVGQLTL